MKTNQTLLFFAIQILIFFSLPAFTTHPTPNAPAPYTLTNSDLTIDANGVITACSYSFANTMIVVPSTVNGNPITGIADGILGGVFENKGITAVALPTSLTKIGIRAFKDNSLTGINLTGLTLLTTIGSNAFSGNSISFVGFTLPANSNSDFVGWRNNDGDEYEGGSVVNNLTKSYNAIIAYRLTDDDVIVDASGFLTSCSYDFSNTDIIIPAILDSREVINISANVFKEKGITYVDLPISLHSVGTMSFYSNNITRLDLSNLTELVYIGVGAFNSNNLQSVDFNNCNNLKSINQGAFWGNNLSSVDLNSCIALEKIDEYAFANNLLGSFILPTNSDLNFIGWRDSEGNEYSGGESVNILTKTYDAILPYFLTNADVVVDATGQLSSCSYNFSNTYIAIPNELDGYEIRTISHDVFKEKGITYVILPEGLLSIGTMAFYLNNISNIDFSNLTELEHIGVGAFDFNKLESVDLSNCISLKTISQAAFALNNLSSIDLNNCSALEKIDENAFAFNNLLSVDLSNCNVLEEIGLNAFAHNYIDSITLPNNSAPNFFKWVNNNEETFFAQSKVPVNNSYRALFKYNLTFYINSGENPVEDAKVEIAHDAFSSYQHTNSAGICGWYSTNYNYEYTVSKQGYYNYSNTVLLDQDRSLHINLTEADPVPENQTINNEDFDNTASGCFNALQSIVIAQNLPVVFEDGSSIDFIAGQSITFLPGTSIQSGAYVHASITNNGSFCVNPQPTVTAQTLVEKSVEMNDNENVSGQKIPIQSMKIFPNPSNGIFTIQLHGLKNENTISIYNSLGKTISEINAKRSQTVDLSHLQKGLYIAKVIDNDKQIIQRLIIR